MTAENWFEFAGAFAGVVASSPCSLDATERLNRRTIASCCDEAAGLTSAPLFCGDILAASSVFAEYDDSTGHALDEGGLPAGHCAGLIGHVLGSARSINANVSP